MNYRRRENIFNYRDALPAQIEKILAFQKLVRRSPYSTKVPEGDLSGPTTISTIAQEVTDTSDPTYAQYLHGFYHRNK